MEQTHQRENITISRDMATHFINTYYTPFRVSNAQSNFTFSPVYPNRVGVLNDKTFKNSSCTDINEFLNSCMMNDNLKTQNVQQCKFVFNIIPKLQNSDVNKICCEDNINNQSIINLHNAYKNYHLLYQENQHYKYIENLDDSSFEPNTCRVCHYENITKPAEKRFLTKFYYSTHFGLNVPVCHECVLSDGDKKDEDSKDIDYYSSIYNKKSTDIEDVDNCDIEDVDNCDIEDVDNCDINNECVDSENKLDNEYKLGFDDGWEAAMKYVEEKVKTCHIAQTVPKCDNCGIICKTRKCGGTCNGRVRYCSVKCQSTHWIQEHKYNCSKLL